MLEAGGLRRLKLLSLGGAFSNLLFRYFLVQLENMFRGTFRNNSSIAEIHHRAQPTPRQSNRTTATAVLDYSCRKTLKALWVVHPTQVNKSLI